MSIKRFIKDIFSPVLSDRTIRKYIEKGLLITTPLTENQYQPNSVDLTLGNTFKIIESNAECFKGNCIDTKSEIIYTSGKISKSYVIEPGEFVLMVSNEILNIPNGIIAFVQGRSSIARLGIQTEQAGLIDAGFNGTITFEVFNQSKHNIVLYPGMRIAQVYFFKAQEAQVIYGEKNKYNGQLSATGSKINNDPELK